MRSEPGRCHRVRTSSYSTSVILRARVSTPSSEYIYTRLGDLGIKPVPESDDDPADADEEEEEDDEKEEDDEEPEVPPPMPKTLAILYDKAKLKKSTVGAHDDSDTEYEESEPEDAPPPTQPLLVKRVATGKPTAARPSPSKKPRLDVTDDSATELEDEDAEPQWILSAPAPSATKKPRPAYDSDADTEEEESDLESCIEVSQDKHCTVRITHLFLYRRCKSVLSSL